MKNIHDTTNENTITGTYSKNQYNALSSSKSSPNLKKQHSNEHLRNQSNPKFFKSPQMAKGGLPPRHQNKVSDRNLYENDKNTKVLYHPSNIYDNSLDIGYKKTIKKDYNSHLAENFQEYRQNRERNNLDTDILENKPRESWRNKSQSKQKVFRNQNYEKKKIEIEKRLGDEKKQEAGIFTKF